MLGNEYDMAKTKFFLSPLILSLWKRLLRTDFSFGNNRRLLWFLAGLVFAVGDRGLVFSSLVAIALLFSIYNYRDLSFKSYFQFLSPSNRRFTIAVSGGGLGAIAFYLSHKIWLEIDSHWLASAFILQGLISSGILGILTWYIYQQKQPISISQNTSFTENINNLMLASPLKRLYGLNQLILQWEKGLLTVTQIQEMTDYLFLMESMETEKIVRNKLIYFLEQLQQLNTIDEPIYYQQKPLKTFQKKKVLTIDN